MFEKIYEKLISLYKNDIEKFNTIIQSVVPNYVETLISTKEEDGIHILTDTNFTISLTNIVYDIIIMIETMDVLINNGLINEE